MNIERISNQTRELVNQFIINNWFSTNIIIRNKVIDATQLDGFLLLEEN